MNNALNLIGRILLAALFLPAGLSKLSGFEGTVGYIASIGLPLPSLAAAPAMAPTAMLASHPAATTAPAKAKTGAD